MSGDRGAAGPPAGTLTESELAGSWLEQFRRWLQEARACTTVVEPEAMVLATANAAGRPSGRTVLLKGVDEAGFAFYTNYGSRKGRELAENPWAALVFPWYALSRQVVVSGAARRASDERSDEYFASRAHASQIGAHASRQSSVIAHREALEEAREQAEQRFPAGGPVPRPPWWGGILLEPDWVEFWQGRPGRLHDRLRYRREAGDWIVERLAP